MRIVIDDAGDVPGNLTEELDIAVVPINIRFGTEEYLSRVDMTHEQFYQKVAAVEAHNFPKTSQPTPYQFEQVFREILAGGEDKILTITVSDKLSGTYASAVAASRVLADEGTFHLFDSKSGSIAQGLMAVEAARMAREGAGYEVIYRRLIDMRESCSLYFLIDNLEYAVKGGRVSSVRGAMASFLNIKPIMTVADGLIVEASKVRTYKRAVTWMIDAAVADVGQRPVKLAVMHANKPDAAQELLKQARPRFKIAEEFLSEIAISVAINLGPGTVGLVVIPEP